jgi:hypothetical protein
LSHVSQAAVLARRSGAGLPPVVIEQSLAPHPAEERVEGPLAGCEVGRLEALQDVRDVLGFLAAASGFLLILLMLAQALGALAWLPVVRRRVGSFGTRPGR